MAAAAGNVLRNLQLNPDQQTRCREVYHDLHWFWVVSIMGTPALDRDLCIRNIQLTGRALHYVLNGGAKPDSTEITIVGDDRQADWATSTVPKLQRWVASSGLKFLKVDDAAKTLILQTYRLHIPCSVTVSFSKAENESLYASVPVLWDKESVLLHEPPQKAPSLKAFIKGLQAGKQPDEAMLDHFWQTLKGSPQNADTVYLLFDAYVKVAKLKEKTACELIVWFFKNGDLKRADRFFKTYWTLDLFKELPTENLSEAQAKQLLHWYKKDATVANLPIIVRCFKICKDVDAFADIYREIYEKNNNIKKETEDFLSDLDPELADQVKKHPLNAHIFAAFFPPKAKKASKEPSKFLHFDQPLLSYTQVIKFLTDLTDDRLNVNSPGDLKNFEARALEALKLIIKRTAKDKKTDPALIELLEKLLKSIVEKMESQDVEGYERLREYYSGIYRILFRIHAEQYLTTNDPAKKKDLLVAFINQYAIHWGYITSLDSIETCKNLAIFVLKTGDFALLDYFREVIKPSRNYAHLDKMIMREANRWFQVKPTIELYNYLKNQKLEPHLFYIRFQLLQAVLTLLSKKSSSPYSKLPYKIADFIGLYDEFVQSKEALEWVKQLKDADDRGWWIDLERNVNHHKPKLSAQIEEKKEEELSDCEWGLIAAQALISQSREDEYKMKIREVAQFATLSGNISHILKVAEIALDKENPYRDALFVFNLLCPIKNLPQVKPIIAQAMTEAIVKKKR